jgi:hypothetical protein
VARGERSAQIYRKTGNLRAVQLLLGHTKIETMVRYLGVEVDDALRLSEQLNSKAALARGSRSVWRQSGHCQAF